MKYAVCILVHNKPELLERIVTRLISHNVAIFVHLDARCDITDYKYINNVHFIEKRVKVYWGGRSMVLAMRNLIEHVLTQSDCDYLIFISGQDFPIISPDKYPDYIDTNHNYLEYEKLPKRDWYTGGLDRVKYFYFFKTSKTNLSKAFIRLQKLFRFERKYDVKFVIYGGSQWIQINVIAAKYILDNWENYYSYFRTCNIPDEMIFQTILLNSPFRNTIVNNNFRYLRYDQNGFHAAYLDERDLELIKKSNALFCRKVKNSEIFIKLEKMLSFKD